MSTDPYHEPYYTPHEMDRRDLTDSAAIVVGLPDLSGSWMFSDQTQGSLHRQAFAWNEEGIETRALYEELIAQEVRNAVAALPEGYLLETVEARPYHIGPHAQSWPLYIVRFIEDAKPILEDGVLLYTLGQIAYSIITRARTWVGAEASSDSAAVSLSEPLLQSLAYAHAFDTYGVQGTVKLKSHYRTAFHGYGEPEHFGGAETYLIQIRGGDVTYCYVLDARAKVTEHFRVYDNEVTPLPLPNWHSDGYFPQQNPHNVRDVRVQSTE